jgi:hypothetical protein
MNTRKNDAASRPDDESPEWTVDDFRKARPALEVLGEVFGAEAAEAVRRQLVETDRKVNPTSSHKRIKHRAK